MTAAETPEGNPAPLPAGGNPLAPEQRVTLERKGDLSNMQAEAGSGFRHPMRGFEREYTDIVDWIVRVTHRVWEENDLSYIYDTYQHNVSLWTTNGLTKGREAIVANSVKVLSAYPNGRIYVDDVVWSGNEEDGYHTSMRATSVRHNTGYTAYGPPTGRRVVRRGIANCIVRENRIVEEWTAHDELTVVRQLGFNPHEIAARLARAEAERGGVHSFGGDLDRMVGQGIPPHYTPRSTGGGFDVEDFVRRGYQDIWNRRQFSAIVRDYHPDAIVRTSSNKEFHGHGDHKAHVLALLGAFPDAQMTVEHVYWMGGERDGYRTAVRWSLVGTHDGPGFYGPPSGRRMRVMGLTQHRIQHEQITEEWTVFDEIALMKQLVVL